MNVIAEWFQRRFSDPQLVILTAMVLAGVIILLFFGQILAPVLAAVVIAYLLTGPVSRLERSRVPRLVAVLVVFSVFLVFVCFLLLRLLPLLWQQAVQLVQETPAIISWGQRELLRLPERFPEVVTEQQVIDITNVLRSELTSLGQRVLSFSVASLRSVALILLYLFLMPIMIFFFLKDRERIVLWATGFLPDDRRVASEVWHEADQQIGHYVRGKFWEILIVWAATFLFLRILGMQFAMLVSFFVGLSVLIPYVGAIVMAFPVASIAYFQWGASPQVLYVIIGYVVIQLIDGHVLVPLLFSEIVNLHPVAIIVAVLVFGGVWGFWGVFFAIPLATLVQSILKAWGRRRSYRLGDEIEKTHRAEVEEEPARP